MQSLSRLLYVCVKEATSIIICSVIMISQEVAIIEVRAIMVGAVTVREAEVTSNFS